jgi:hypothetical protein
MYQLACGTLLLVGLILNCTDRRMLALTVIVGASVFLPVPVNTALEFYSICIISEIFVGVMAYRTGREAGFLVANACVLLVIAHAMGYALDGSPPLSPYRLIVKILEISQLLVCAALSPVIEPVLRNDDATI